MVGMSESPVTEPMATLTVSTKNGSTPTAGATDQHTDEEL